MIKQTFKFLLALTGVGMIFSSALAASSHWYQLNPLNIKTLNQFVKSTQLFDKAKGPTVKQTQLYSIEANSGNHYSIYTMEPQKTYGHVTKYKTTEQVANGAGFGSGIGKYQPVTVHGKGLSLGGIFWPKEQMIIYGSNHKKIYDNRIRITAIKPLSGHLFPMHVGNVLKFKFKRSHYRLIDGKVSEENSVGTMTYKVINQFNQFSYSNKKIPHPIYEIEVWEKTNLHPKPYLTDIYEYSAGFHWYISDKYFNKNNQLLAWYRVKNWH